MSSRTVKNQQDKASAGQQSGKKAAGPAGKIRNQHLQQSREMIRNTLERYLKMLTQIK